MPPQVERCEIKEAIISHGCTVRNSIIDHAVIGLRSNIEANCTIRVCWVGVGSGVGQRAGGMMGPLQPPAYEGARHLLRLARLCICQVPPWPPPS